MIFMSQNENSPNGTYVGNAQFTEGDPAFVVPYDTLEVAGGQYYAGLPFFEA
jgi:hypothetical protein